MKPLLFIASILFFGIAQTQTFDNWTTTATPGTNGVVYTYSDNRADSNTVRIEGSDGELLTNADIDFTGVISIAGIYSFDWEYQSNDYVGNPRYDVAGVLLNGSFLQLSVNAGGSHQTGTYTTAFLQVGVVIGFRVRAIDNLFGNATFTISNFKVPEPDIITPEPPFPYGCVIKIFSNPVYSNVRLILGCFDNTKTVKLYNAVGRLIAVKRSNNPFIDWDTELLKSGMYYFIISGEKKAYKFIKL